MPGRDMICMGASAGGLEAVREIVKHFSSELPASVFVVIHTSPTAHSQLPCILERTDHMSSTSPHNGETIRRGHIYTAPPDLHMMVGWGKVWLSRGPKENLARPAVDPLFRTAAQYYGPRSIGVVLSGALSDGTAGLLEVKKRGGLAIVQDPADAAYAGMPQSAINNVDVDYILPKDKIGPLLVQLASQHVEKVEEEPVSEDSRVIDEDKAAQAVGESTNASTTLTCPECGGVVWELRDGDLIRYRCHVGHAYSIDNMVAGMSERLESSLWTAVRGLQEKAMIHERVANSPAAERQPEIRQQAQKVAKKAEQDAQAVLGMLTHASDKNTTD